MIQEVQECQGWRQAGTRPAPVEVNKYHRTTGSNSIPFSSPKEEQLAIFHGRVEKEEQLGTTQGKNDKVYRNTLRGIAHAP